MPIGSPIWFFSARALAPQVQLTEIKMLALDKRTGHVAMQTVERSYAHGFEFAVDAKERLVDITLLGSQQPIRHRLKLTDQPLPDAAAAPGPEKPVAKPPEPQKKS
ncbi:MAG: hypothetical protein JWM11_7470 [Planctomycetaceae bacterium]|nr:hypothetical protein [Planctomycetaceae bacterium]